MKLSDYHESLLKNIPSVSTRRFYRSTLKEHIQGIEKYKGMRSKISVDTLPKWDQQIKDKELELLKFEQALDRYEII